MVGIRTTSPNKPIRLMNSSEEATLARLYHSSKSTLSRKWALKWRSVTIVLRRNWRRNGSAQANTRSLFCSVGMRNKSGILMKGNITAVMETIFLVLISSVADSFRQQNNSLLTRANHDLAQANQLRTQMTTNIAHDLEFSTKRGLKRRDISMLTYRSRSKTFKPCACRKIIDTGQK